MVLWWVNLPKLLSSTELILIAQMFFASDFEKLLLQPRKNFTRPMQPISSGGHVISAPSLILHGRTEIKARALVLGEVGALSFCLLAILPERSLTQRRKAAEQACKFFMFLCVLSLRLAPLRETALTAAQNRPTIATLKTVKRCLRRC